MEAASTAEPEGPPEEPTRGLPRWLQATSIGLLSVTMLYGTVFNVALLLVLSRVRSLRSAMNRILMMMAGQHVTLSLVVTLPFIYRLLNLTQRHPGLHRATCVLISAGLLFTNLATMLTITLMAFVRYRIVSAKQVTSTALRIAMLSILGFSFSLSCYYMVKGGGGVMTYICIDPNGIIPQGKNYIMFLLIMPFGVSVTVTLFSYYRIYQITHSHVAVIESSQRSRSLLRPMLSIFLSFFLTYTPILCLSLVRRLHGMSVSVSHAHWITFTLNCSGYALHTTAYSMQSQRVRNILLNLMPSVVSRHTAVHPQVPQVFHVGQNPQNLNKTPVRV